MPAERLREKPKGTSCVVYDEGEFYSDEQPAYDIAHASACIEQIAGWHENSGQSEIIAQCKKIRTLLVKAMSDD